MQRLGHHIEYLFFVLASWFLCLLPISGVQRAGRALGWTAYRVMRYRRGVTLDNLRQAFPGLKEEEIDVLACKAYKNISTTFHELLWFPRLTRESLGELVECENPEFAATVKARKKGILFLTAHFGSWELCAQAASQVFEMPMLIIVKTQANGLVDKAVNGFRTQFGNSVVPMQHAVRQVLETLRQGGAVGLAADQSASRESVWTEFFGRVVPTHQGPAVFVLRTGSILVVSFAVRQSTGHYRMRFEIIPTDDLSPDDPASVLELTRRHVSVTEKMIRQYPEQWLWMHRRWKHAATPGSAGGEE